MNAATKTALVTGGSRGIGRAIAQRLAADGFAVVVNYAGNASKARETVAAIESLGARALAIRADVADAQEVGALYASAIEAFGQIDVVVNSAGVMPVESIDEASLDEFDRVIATNLRGTFLMMAEAAKHLGEGGRFIALSSSVLAKNFPGYGPYIASKAGWKGWCACLPMNSEAVASPSMLSLPAR